MMFWTNTGSSNLQNSNCTATYLLSHKPPKSDQQDMLGTAGEIKMNSSLTFANGLEHINTPMLAGQQKLTIISSVQTLDIVKKTCQERWTKGIDIKR